MKFLQEIPKIGEKYKIPCVVGSKNGKNVLTPVVNEFAIDNDILNADLVPHVHIDRRFCTDEIIDFHMPPNKYKPLSGLALAIMHYQSLPLKTLNELIYEEEFECVKPQDFVENIGRSTYLEKMHCNKKMTCRKCPHQGTDLSSYFPDEEGNITCPAHGLAWNKDSGKLVQRKTLQEKMVRNYLKHYPLPEHCNVSTFTNDLRYCLTQNMKISDFEINLTQDTSVKIGLDPFKFITSTCFYYRERTVIFGYVFWKNDMPILAQIFERPADNCGSMEIVMNLDFSKDV